MSDPYPAAEASTPSAKPNRPRLLDRLLSLVRREPEDREGIMAVLDAARERELIDADAYSMLKGALAVSEQTAVDVMVPRARMDLLDVSQSIATLMPEIIETAHSRFPVFEGSRDNIIGVVMTKDLLRHLLNPDLTLRDLVRPAVFIPESKRLNILLQEFRRNRNHIAVVIDEQRHPRAGINRFGQPPPIIVVELAGLNAQAVDPAKLGNDAVGNLVGWHFLRQHQRW